MTSDVDGNYWAAYTYGIDRISAEDLVSIEGRPNNPLYYLHDALGTLTSFKNYNNGNTLKALQKGDLKSFVTQYNGDGQVEAYTSLMKKKAEEYKNAK